MKILYAIQATGNGHISRGREIIPLLCQFGEVDILLSGTDSQVNPDYPVRYRMHGLGFKFGKKGDIDLWATIKQAKILRFLKDMIRLKVHEYDVIINDFEPLTAWACKLKGKKAIGLGHQYAVLSQKAPKAKVKSPLGQFILKYYAPCAQTWGFHFQAYDKNIFTPVIRKEIRQLYPSDNKHFTVYLPAYSINFLKDIFCHLPNVNWHIFHKNCQSKHQINNITYFPVGQTDFLESLAGASGVIMGAGFEGPAEALFLRKKLLVIPMLGQYEQQCNAAALEKMGIPVVKKLSIKSIKVLQEFVLDETKISVNYPDQTWQILTNIFNSYRSDTTISPENYLPSPQLSLS